MPLPEDRTYPKKATEAAWQKKKTLADKTIKKTGLSPKLKAAQKRWSEIRWDTLDVGRLTPQNAQSARIGFNHARDELIQHVTAARVALDEAKETAKAAAENTKLSKGARSYAMTIAEEVQKAEQRLAGIQPDLEQYGRKVQEMEAAQRDLTAVEIYDGHVLVGNAAKALHDHNQVIIKDIRWKLKVDDRRKLRGRKLNVRASAGNTLFVEDLEVREVQTSGLTLQS